MRLLAHSRELVKNKMQMVHKDSKLKLTDKIYGLMSSKLGKVR
jgi:hypothetical protein